jgi:RNA polymerase sigma factor (sigma-70 family)
MTAFEAGPLAAKAADDLYRRHASEVYRYALAVLGNTADAEDITQTTFLNAYRSLESGVRPRKPANWLLAIASNLIKERFRTESTRPPQAVLGEQAAPGDTDETPSIGELMAALGQIPPSQRQAIVLREFEGRSYAEIAEILGVTTSALETLLFRARRSLAEELESQLSCSEAQLAVSRAVDARLGRKERRRLRAHIQECPDCARFARLQQRNRRALRGLTLVPVPVLAWPFKGVEGQAAAAVSVPSAAAGLAAAGSGAGTATGVLGGGVALKAATLATAASVAAGVGIPGGTAVEPKDARTTPPQVVAVEKPGKRAGQVAPRGFAVPGNGVALGRARATGAGKSDENRARRKATQPKPATPASTRAQGSVREAGPGRSMDAKARVPREAKSRAEPPANANEQRRATPVRGGASHGPPPYARRAADPPSRRGR